MKAWHPCVILIAAAISVTSASAQSLLGRNAIVNPGAEQVDAAGGIQGWSKFGNFNAETYGSPQLPGPNDPGPPNRGSRFFSGGPSNASSNALQVIVIPPDLFSVIDAGLVKFDLSAWLGGFGMEDDNAAFTLDFKNGANSLAPTTTLGPVMARDRSFLTSFVQRAAAGMVPPNTRAIEIRLNMTRAFGVYNDAYADELSLVLSQIFSCDASAAVASSLRSEGATELAGDLMLTCTGGTPTDAGKVIPSADISVLMNATVTTRLKTLKDGTASEVLLVVDEPNTTLPGASTSVLACDAVSGCSMTGNGTGAGTYSGVTGRPNIFQGVVSGSAITFKGVPIDAPAASASRVFRITGLRINASVPPPPGSSGFQVVASVSATNFPIRNNQQTVGFAQNGLQFSLRDGSNAAALTGAGSVPTGSGPTPAGAPSAFLRFSERFGNAFKTRTIAPFSGTEVAPAPASQNVPGVIYNSESGLTIAGVAGPADSGTRLKAVFNGLPPGVSVWVGVINNANTVQKAARLISSEAGAFTPTPVAALVGSSGAVQIPVVNGSGSATWEVLAGNPNSIEDFDFPVWLIAGASVNLVGAADGSLAPNPANGAISSSTVATASSSLPIPRFTYNSLPSGPGSSPGVTRVISQMVDGGSWKTTIILINSDIQPSAFTLRFWDESGFARSIPLGPDGLQSQLTGTIAPGGSRTIETDGIGSSALTSWAELQSASAVTGFGIFRQRVEGRPDQEAAVPLVAGADRFALPFDNTQGSVTGVALVNSNSALAANSSAVFRAEDGSTIAPAPVNLPAHGHTAFAMPDLFPALANRRGVAEFSFANPDVTALGLRFNASAAFTSLPMLAFNDTALNAPSRSLSQVADGSGWKTTFLLTNMDTEPAPFTLRFWKDDSTALRLQFEGGIGGASDTVSATIPVGGSMTLVTSGTDPVLSQGWAEFTTTRKIGGLGVFRLTVAGRPDQEAAVPLATSVGRFVLAFDNTQGAVTAMALANTNGLQPVLVSVLIRDEAGTQIATDVMAVAPHAHTAFALADRFPSVANRRGVVEFSTNSAALSGLGLRFNSSGAFTSFPIIPK